ncbi:hypothetical protein GF374_03625, partial [Candidatus Woesearchaeota archaeon]|nr:hypothetical protein [Candidatus Woesearchaeota archaeon]
MADDISTHHVYQFADNVMLKAGQEGSRLRGAVIEKRGPGERIAFDRIGNTEMVQLTSRHQASPHVDMEHDRRWATLSDWVWGRYVDKQDLARMLQDPQSTYAQAARRAAGVKIDQLIIDAMFGSAVSGKLGDSTTALGSGQKILYDDLGSGVADKIMTVEKLIAGKELMDDAEVPDDGRHIAMKASGFADLL